MTAPFVRIEPFGVERVAGMFGQAPDIVLDELRKAMVESDLFLAREVAERTPTAHGLLRSSIFSEERVTADGVIGVVASPLEHATYVELGTRPHFPPLEPIIDWVKTKGIAPADQAESVAYLIARAIAVRGTLAVGMFNRAFAYAQPQIARRFEMARDRALERMRAAGAG